MKQDIQRTRLAANKALATPKPLGEILEETDFLPGEGEGAMSAGLQSRLKSIAERHSLGLRSARALQTRVIDRVAMIGARIELAGTIAALRGVIYTIENSTPPLYVASAVIRANPASALPKASEEPLLEAQLDVFGIIKSGAQQ